MVTDRVLEAGDLPVLTESLARDEYHKGTAPKFFTETNTACKVYEMNGKPVMFVRGTAALRIDIQFVDNNDKQSNAAVMLSGFESFAANAKANGFTEIIFNSESPLLTRFCREKFGFVESQGELRKFL